MQQRNGRLLFSPSDLSAFLACRHLARLELGVARGEVARPEGEDAQGELIRRKGDEHERAYVEALLADSKDVVTIFRGEREEDWDLARAAGETEEAMRAGAEVIYQGVLVSPDGWRGLADFLERVDVPSALGDWSYEVADTKLARRPKPAHLLQLCFYSAEVARLQGVEPAQMHLVLGSGERESFRPADFDAYFRRARTRFLEFIAAEPATYPLPVDHCSICDFLPRCEQQWIDDDHLTPVARMRRDQIARLEDFDIDRLATLDDHARLPGARPRKHDRRPVAVRDGTLLVLVQTPHRFKVAARGRDSYGLRRLLSSGIAAIRRRPRSSRRGAPRVSARSPGRTAPVPSLGGNRFAPGASPASGRSGP